MLENSRVIIKAPDFRHGMRNQKDQLLSRLSQYRNMSFDNFDAVTNVSVAEHDSLSKAGLAAYNFAQDPRADRVWLFLMGTYGCGKTHLAAAIANYRDDMGDEVMFITVPDLLDYLRTTFAPKADVSFDKLFNRIRNVELLVLDDLGTESTKEWAQEKLFQILDHRYVSRLPTVITTSKQINELPERLLSRLLDIRICRNIGIKASSYAKRLKSQ